MKRILFVTCIGSLALTLTALGAHKGKSAHRSGGHKARSAHVVSRGGGHHVSHASRGGGRHVRHATASRHSVTRHNGRSVARANHNSRSSHTSHAKTAQVNRKGHVARDHNRLANNRGRNVSRTHNERSSHATTARATRARNQQANARVANRERNIARAHNQAAHNQAVQNQRNRAQTAQANVSNAARRNFAASRGRNVTLGTNHVAQYRGREVPIVNNWQQPRFRNNPSYSAFYNYGNYEHWHDRSWWNNNYSNITFVLGGWWYWNAGYWYPAWGYDPYASYVYAGPIYTGSASLTPHQIVANVQVALRDWGYNPGAIDGVLGPHTRAAIAAFQTDEGLLVTSAIDRPTLQTLGLT
jgi:hypothetical protein